MRNVAVLYFLTQAHLLVVDPHEVVLNGAMQFLELLVQLLPLSISQMHPFLMKIEHSIVMGQKVPHSDVLLLEDLCATKLLNQCLD